MSNDLTLPEPTAKQCAQMTLADLIGYGPQFPPVVWKELTSRASPADGPLSVLRMTATYHDPDNPELDVHGVDHSGEQGIAAVDISERNGKEVILTLRRKMSASELVTLRDHLRSWHPCIGFAEGK